MHCMLWKVEITPELGYKHAISLIFIHANIREIIFEMIRFVIITALQSKFQVVQPDNLNYGYFETIYQGHP